jgi:hypothetical protein
MVITDKEAISKANKSSTIFSSKIFDISSLMQVNFYNMRVHTIINELIRTVNFLYFGGWRGCFVLFKFLDSPRRLRPRSP